ncbi:MAG: enoyl-CoA hydratase/isomerase family protein [Bdellovibrio sp.]|nr:enoyl-CoA hydratase/isomerase family protein [Bdellovibrio sp.]
MTNLLSLTHFELNLDKETKTLWISPSAASSAALELTPGNVLELEQIWTWLTNHIEISTVVMQSQTGKFASGANLAQITQMSLEELRVFQERLQRVIYAAFFLPQTIIYDLGEGGKDFAAELALLADIRVARNTCHLHFDHLQKGLVPSSGGIGLLSTLIGPFLVRNLCLSGHPLTADDLKNQGLVLELYSNRIERDQIMQGLLEQITAQSPVARIQAKRAMLELVRKSFEEGLAVERNFGRAAHHLQDWKTGIQATLNGKKAQYLSAEDVVNKVRNLHA